MHRYGLNNLAIIYNVVFKNERPELPSNPALCPAELATLIQECWQPEPKHRPSTGEIIKSLTLIGKVRDWQYQQQLQLQQQQQQQQQVLH